MKVSAKGLLETAAVPVGDWTILVRAVDDVGNETTESEVRIEVF
jgi:hypothetical protein